MAAGAAAPPAPRRASLADEDLGHAGPGAPRHVLAGRGPLRRGSGPSALRAPRAARSSSETGICEAALTHVAAATPSCFPGPEARARALCAGAARGGRVRSRQPWRARASSPPCSRAPPWLQREGAYFSACDGRPAQPRLEPWPFGRHTAGTRAASSRRRPVFAERAGGLPALPGLPASLSLRRVPGARRRLCGARTRTAWSPSVVRRRARLAWTPRTSQACRASGPLHVATPKHTHILR